MNLFSGGGFRHRLRVAAWRGSHTANSGTKQCVIFLSDRFSYKLSFFNRLDKSWFRWRTKAMPVYSANQPACNY
jgi:hypothetical protein